ncbi:MAG: hypothetical protein U1A78_03265 [Polyangia bacterium]
MPRSLPPLPQALPSFVESELAALTMAQARVRGSGATEATAAGAGADPVGEGSRLRAVRWRNILVRLGAPLPLFLVHDLGLLLGTPHAELIVGAASAQPGQPETWLAVGLVRRYQALLRGLMTVEPIEQIAAQRPSDELVAALLHRLAADLATKITPQALLPQRAELPLGLLGAGALREGELVRRAHAAGAGLHATLAAWLRLLTSEPVPMQLLTTAELLDPATVRLLNATAGTAAGAATSASGGEPELLGAALDELGGAVDLVDLLGVLAAPEVRDVVRFSLQLMPSLLAPQRASSAHTFPTGGYAALLHRGPLDAALPHELAGDEELFLLKLLHGELLYYGRDQEQHKPRRLHDILIDASPSMRGRRQVFARGLGLALARRLLRSGGAVRVRCFDGRIHEGVRVDQQPARLGPYLLSFRSQRGRNYGQVLRDLAAEYAGRGRGAGPHAAAPGPGSGPGSHGEPAEICTYLVTHGEFHVAPELLQGVQRRAFLYGVFLFPEGELLQEALPLFHRVQVVREDALASEAAQRERALAVLESLADPAAGASRAPA